MGPLLFTWYTEARQDGCKLLCWPLSQCCSYCNWSDETFFNLLLLVLANPCKMKRVINLLHRLLWKMPNNGKLPFFPQGCISVPLTYPLKSLHQSEHMFVARHSEICIYHFEVSGTLLFVLKSCSRGVFKERGYFCLLKMHAGCGGKSNQDWEERQPLTWLQFKSKPHSTCWCLLWSPIEARSPLSSSSITPVMIESLNVSILGRAWCWFMRPGAELQVF